ncbi:hypothetical protein PCL_01626 [Purpureocillium lilacinum]|uniref:Uncharacterized protein n=1 Tax=Purpureocillium lilacinum TaxID=33203 RepID=A0A2U3E209_PURLI|nr:hypothetical protein Purlil1_75 [Purpureocillium lilacinum]PWI68537.1 hypothetical protein PCL_01626 [Purpureocillium lilacinum]
MPEQPNTGALHHDRSIEIAQMPGKPGQAAVCLSCCQAATPSRKYPEGDCSGPPGATSLVHLLSLAALRVPVKNHGFWAFISRCDAPWEQGEGLVGACMDHVLLLAGSILSPTRCKARLRCVTSHDGRLALALALALAHVKPLRPFHVTD